MVMAPNSSPRAGRKLKQPHPFLARIGRAAHTVARYRVVYPDGTSTIFSRKDSTVGLWVEVAKQADGSWTHLRESRTPLGRGSVYAERIG